MHFWCCCITFNAFPFFGNCLLGVMFKDWNAKLVECSFKLHGCIYYNKMPSAKTYSLVITRSQMTQTSHSQRKHRIHCTTVQQSVLTLSNKSICIRGFPGFEEGFGALVLWLQCGRGFLTSALVVDNFRQDLKRWDLNYIFSSSQSQSEPLTSKTNWIFKQLFRRSGLRWFTRICRSSRYVWLASNVLCLSLLSAFLLKLSSSWVKCYFHFTWFTVSAAVSLLRCPLCVCVYELSPALSQTHSGEDR